MNRDEEPLVRSRTLREHFRDGLKKMLFRRRPLSFYLVFAILAVVLLGVQIVHVRGDAHRYALFLALNFVFFLVVLFVAVLDCFDILRGAFRERETLFRDTLGDEGFASELGERVKKGEGASDTPPGKDP